MVNAFLRPSRHPKPIQRKRRVRDRPKRERQQRTLIVISRDSVRPDHAARRAPMHDRPLSPTLKNPPDLDRDRLHRRAARACPVPRLVIDMTRPQTHRTMVPVLRPPRLRGDVGTAVHTHEIARLVGPGSIKLVRHWFLAAGSAMRSESSPSGNQPTFPAPSPQQVAPTREESDNPEAETLRDAIRCENHTDRAAGLA